MAAEVCYRPGRYFNLGRRHAGQAGVDVRRPAGPEGARDQQLVVIAATSAAMPGGFVVLRALVRRNEQFHLPTSTVDRRCRFGAWALSRAGADKRQSDQGAPATRPVSRPSSINPNLFRSSSILA